MLKNFDRDAKRVGGGQPNSKKLLYIASLYSVQYTSQRNNYRTSHSENGQVPPVSAGTSRLKRSSMTTQHTIGSHLAVQGGALAN